MRTNIVLDDSLVKKGLRISNVKTKRELVFIALKEYVDSHVRKDIRDLFGKIKFDRDYDYKKLRRGF